MANSPQARKRIRQAEKARQHNVSLRSKMRTFIKKVRAAADAGNKEEAKTWLQETSSIMDKLASTGVIHLNKASRLKSRLSRQIKKIV